MTATMTRGDLLPDVLITIADARSSADFSTLTTSQVLIVGEVNGTVKFSDNPVSVTPAPDGKSAVLRYAWAPGDTDTAGRMYIWAVVTWNGSRPQTFPDDRPLFIDIKPAPGDV